LFRAAVQALRNVIVGATAAKKPSKPEDMVAFVKPLSDAMTAVVDYRNKQRGSKEWDHLSTVSEGVAAFGWVAVEPTPGPFATQSRAGAEFYSNKLLRLYKGKDETQMAWLNSFVGFLKDMEEYIKNNHRTGLTFSGTGDAKTAAAAAAPPAGGKAPPPMPKGLLINQDAPAKASGGGDAGKAGDDGAVRAGLFSELNRGGDVTKGLKKVTKDMQTHKNAALRAGGVVKASEVKETSKHRGIPTGTPKGPVLEGNKWVLEYIVDGGKIELTPDMKHSLYVYGCVNTVINISTKINQIQIDSSKKVSLVCNDVLASVDVVNSQAVQLQVLGKSPTIAVEKVSNCQLYLSKDGLDVEIITAKSDSVNVHIPQTNGDFTETPVPEQFKSVVKDGKLVTAQVDHSD